MDIENFVNVSILKYNFFTHSLNVSTLQRETKVTMFGQTFGLLEFPWYVQLLPLTIMGELISFLCVYIWIFWEMT